MADVKLKLRPFTVPNYVLCEMPAGMRQEGRETPKFHISDLSDEVLEALCKEFRNGVFAKKATGKEAG